jgi:hypothetical protein
VWKQGQKEGRRSRPSFCPNTRQALVIPPEGRNLLFLSKTISLASPTQLKNFIPSIGKIIEERNLNFYDKSGGLKLYHNGF